jgi:single-stranded DNA-binding protein
MRIFVAGKLIQRTWQDNDGNKRQSVEIQVTHVGPDLQFATAEVAKSTAEVAKSTAEGLNSSSDARSSAEGKQTA